jgi:hypothetical protein
MADPDALDYAALLEDLAEWCRERWGYLIPADAAGQARLRDLCARTLEFENHFLGGYREWVVGELRAADHDARQAARRMLERVPLADPAIMALQREETC